MKWKILRLMSEQRIKSFRELARRTGFDYRTLLTRIESPDQMRIYELKVLAGVLKISDDDILEIVKGVEK